MHCVGPAEEQSRISQALEQAAGVPAATLTTIAARRPLEDRRSARLGGDEPPASASKRLQISRFVDNGLATPLAQTPKRLPLGGGSTSSSVARIVQEPALVSESARGGAS